MNLFTWQNFSHGEWVKNAFFCNGVAKYNFGRSAKSGKLKEG